MGDIKKGYENIARALAGKDISATLVGQNKLENRLDNLPTDSIKLDKQANIRKVFVDKMAELSEKNPDMAKEKPGTSFLKQLNTAIKIYSPGASPLKSEADITKQHLAGIVMLCKKQSPKLWKRKDTKAFGEAATKDSLSLKSGFQNAVSHTKKSASELDLKDKTKIVNEVKDNLTQRAKNAFNPDNKLSISDFRNKIEGLGGINLDTPGANVFFANAINALNGTELNVSSPKVLGQVRTFLQSQGYTDVDKFKTLNHLGKKEISKIVGALHKAGHLDSNPSLRDDFNEMMRDAGKSDIKIAPDATITAAVETPKLENRQASLETTIPVGMG